MTTTTTASPFETETCTRCGGTGEFSFNQVNGTTCFKCGTRNGVPGSGLALTKRGVAAKHFYEDSLSMGWEELRPGMLVREIGYRQADGTIKRTVGQRIRVTSVEFIPAERARCFRIVDGERVGVEQVSIDHARGGMVVFPNTVFMLIPSAEVREEKLAAALAYQATLTKAGKPRKA